MKKSYLIPIIIALVALVGLYFLLDRSPREVDDLDPVDIPDVEEPATSTPDTATTTDDVSEEETETVIGTSVEGRDITAYHFGDGDRDVIFVGGIHGGYSWNTALLTFELIDYLETNPDFVPEDVRVHVIPVMNPDGLALVTGSPDRFASSDVPDTREETIPGRFNANDVDLNRNFDCQWQAEGVWQEREVSGGNAPFSEPESQAVRDFVIQTAPEAVVVYYAQAGGVFSSNCENGVLDATADLTDLYANASGYQSYQEFDFYEITGDMVNWLAKNEVPGISVLLSDHESIEWTQNREGIEAVLEYVSQ